MELSKFSFDFSLKTKTKFGVGSAKKLAQFLKESSFQNIGIILDNNICDNLYVKEIIDGIVKHGFHRVISWNYDLASEPDYDSLDKIKLQFLNSSGKPLVNCFVAIGGGSVIDFAKGLATLVVNPGPSLKYRGFPQNINPSLPVIALPTTAGTASEVTYNAVFIDSKTNKKLGINTEYNYPFLAVIDPKLTMDCPRSVTLSSGGDAIVHAIESYVAVQANPYTRIFSKEAFKLVYNALPKVIKYHKNIEFRSQMSFGSYLAGIGLMNSGSGPAGALSYLIGPYFSIPHGFAGVVFLPYVVQHNVDNGYDYSELYDLIEGANHSLNNKMKSKEFVNHIESTWKEIGMPTSLTAFKIDKIKIQNIINEVDKFEAAFAQNPLPFTVEDGKNLLFKLVQH